MSDFQLLLKNNNKCLNVTGLNIQILFFPTHSLTRRTPRNVSPFLFWSTRTAKRKTAPLSYPVATTTDTLAVVEEETIRAARRLVLNRRRLLSAAVTTIALRVPDGRHR